MRTLALCGGIAGIEMGLARFGAELTAYAELDKAACAVMAHHYPAVPNYGDITTAKWWSLRDRIDLLTAGFPCQTMSFAGLRKVKNDDRWLWPFLARSILVVRPRRVFLENVGALLVPWRDDDGWWHSAPIEEVLGDMAQMGFDAEWGCVRASDTGAPHQRERAFVLATHPGRVESERRGGRAELVDEEREREREEQGQERQWNGNAVVHPRSTLADSYSQRSHRSRITRNGGAISGASQRSFPLLPTPTTNDGRGGGSL